MKSKVARTALAGAAAGLIAFAVAAAAPGVGNAGGSLSTSRWTSRLTAAQVSVLSANADQRVIVLLRNQRNAFATQRAPVVAQLRQLHAPRLVTYETVNAVATTVSAAEAANLRRNPAVLAVAPDVVVKGPSSNANLLPRATRATAHAASRMSPRAASSSKKVCGTANAPLLEPQALHLINADNRTNANSPLTSGPKSAHSLGYTGAGVNIAVFPDGMDPKLPDFQRNGQSAVTDYRDFSGEGPNAKTGGGEAFGDVSSLVAQGNTTYNLDQEINPDFATTGGTCAVKVLGVAPGADVDVMKVFGSSNASFTSVILQGIDWAIQHDHADILSISIGFGGLPTSAAEQPLTAILENAMHHGTVVVASTGDSSPSNTEGSPALDPGVIGTAASTSYRLFAQTNLFLYDMAQAVHNHKAPSYRLGQSTPGWLDNQVSTLSSSGVTEDRRVPDLIAPGDLNWAACSTDISTYTDCENAIGGSSIGLVNFGGTSESTPLTAGTAALVIEAYRQSHHKQNPSPAVVRQILFSSATDLGISAENQGAGLLNALRAVQLAKSWGKHAKGGGLVHSPDSIADLGNVKGKHRHTVVVKNTGNSKARIRPVLRTLGKARNLASGKLNLFEAGHGPQGSCAGVQTAKYFTGETIPELNCKTFKVPKGVDALDSRIAWNPLQNCATCTSGEPTVREILIDPKGRYAQYSDPQGLGVGFADAQVHQPAAGTWTLLIFGRHTSNYEGAVSFQETAQTFQTVRQAVTPASRVVRPGKSASFTVKVPAPTKPGFFTGAVVFHSNRQSKLGTIPVVSEAKVPVTTKKAGKFSGTLIGGNGRPGAYAQELSYEFTVPKGVHDLNVNMHASHDGYLLLGQLVDPHGNAVDSQLSFQQVDQFGNSDNTNAVQLVWADPTPGTWRVNVANGLFFLPGLDVYSGLTHATLQRHGQLQHLAGHRDGDAERHADAREHRHGSGPGEEHGCRAGDVPARPADDHADAVRRDVGDEHVGHAPDHLRRPRPAVHRPAVQQPAEGEREHHGLDADPVRPQPVLGRAGCSLPGQLGRSDERHGQQAVRVGVGACPVRGRSVRLRGDAGGLLHERRDHHARLRRQRGSQHRERLGHRAGRIQSAGEAAVPAPRTDRHDEPHLHRSERGGRHDRHRPGSRGDVPHQLVHHGRRRLELRRAEGAEVLVHPRLARDV